VLLYAVSDKRALLYFIQYVTCELVPDELRPSEAAREKKGHKAVMKSVARVPKSSYRCFKAHLDGSWGAKFAKCPRDGQECIKNCTLHTYIIISRAHLFKAPSYGSKEIVLVYGRYVNLCKNDLLWTIIVVA